MKLNAALFSAAAFTLFGCSTPGPYLPQNSGLYDHENHERVVLLDRAVQRSVTLEGIKEVTLADSRLKVVANLRNQEGRRIEVQANCIFKDEDGFSTGDETPFQTVILAENAQEAISFTSMNEKAKKYTIRVRQAR
jgi:uncharacterized protein YcfL